jgi:predicted transcriptional regulator
MTDMKIVVGDTLKDDATAFLTAWHRAEAGETTTERVLACESWDGLARVMTGDRYRLLRHLHAQPAASVSALARERGR